MTARHQPQWPVNSLALAVLPELLDLADLPAWSEAIATARKELAELFRRFGFAVEAGDAPWVLVHAPGLRKLLAPHGGGGSGLFQLRDAGICAGGGARFRWAGSTGVGYAAERRGGEVRLDPGTVPQR